MTAREGGKQGWYRSQRRGDRNNVHCRGSSTKLQTCSKPAIYSKPPRAPTSGCAFLGHLVCSGTWSSVPSLDTEPLTSGLATLSFLNVPLLLTNLDKMYQIMYMFLLMVNQIEFLKKLIYSIAETWKGKVRNGHIAKTHTTELTVCHGVVFVCLTNSTMSFLAD